MKYIIKNCPNCHPDFWINCTGKAENKGFRCLCLSPTNVYCKDTNCLLKQIVEKCKDFKKPLYEIDNGDGTISAYYSSNKDLSLADDILNILLEIEEVNE